MASLFRVLCTCLIIFFAASTMNTSVEAARQFIVGDHLGWHEPDSNNTAFYLQWAERNRFQVGDSLVFEYQNDSVLTVEKDDYFNCDTSNPITAFDNGKSILNLDRPGAFYFISGTDDHCNNGQKLLVEVMAPHPIPKSSPSPSPSPSISLAPEGLSAMAPSPSDGLEGDTEPASGSAVLSSVPIASLATCMASLATFVIVLLLTP